MEPLQTEFLPFEPPFGDQVTLVPDKSYRDAVAALGSLLAALRARKATVELDLLTLYTEDGYLEVWDLTSGTLVSPVSGD